jgi:type II secretory pathway component GspD/PulD (secretin)
MTRLAIVATACAVFAWGQPAKFERQVTLAHLKSPDALAPMLRIVAALTTVTPDSAARTITMTGTAEQIALAGWLIAQLDKADGVVNGSPEYRVPGSDDDITRVLPVVHATGNREVVELGTVVRSIFEIRKLYTFADTNAVIVRGTAAQIAGAEWLLPKLDRPVSTIGDKRDDRQRFRPIGSTDPDDSVAVLHIANTSTEQSHSSAVTSIRSTTQARRAFVYMPTRVIVIRGTAEQLATAEAMVADMDKPAV